MNKYEEAYYEMHRLFRQIPYAVNVIKTLPLQELVDRATPKTPYKPLGGRDHNGFPIDGVCGSCGKVVKKYCSCSNNDCRQAIDWSKDE